MDWPHPGKLLFFKPAMRPNISKIACNTGQLTVAGPGVPGIIYSGQMFAATP